MMFFKNCSGISGEYFGWIWRVILGASIKGHGKREIAMVILKRDVDGEKEKGRVRRWWWLMGQTGGFRRCSVWKGDLRRAAG